MPLLFAVLLGFVVSWGSLSYVTDTRLKVQAGETTAINFLMYQNALSSYLATYPLTPSSFGVAAGSSMTVNDGSMTFPPGYVRNTAFTHIFTNNTLYTYAPPASVTPGFLGQLTKTNRYSVAKVTASGTAVGLGGSKSVPTSIPVGSVVIIGE